MIADAFLATHVGKVVSSGMIADNLLKHGYEDAALKAVYKRVKFDP